MLPEDLTALYGDPKKRDNPVTLDTFKTLDKVQQIHNNCKVLMQAGLQTLALDIMEQMTLHQEGLLKQVSVKDNKTTKSIF